MRIISCAGYYGTGSSAITDYISEFENVYSLTEYEFRFLHDPDGISDLEYNLVENHNRHNSGHALKRYKRLVDFYAGNKWISRYEPFFDNKWKKISYEYINELTDFTYNGWWQYDLLDRGEVFYYRKMLLNKILKRTVWRNNSEKVLNVLPHEVTYCSKPSEEKFIKCTNRYLNKLFKAANKGNKPSLMVDQIVPPSNLNRYLRYFDDIKVFVVERDPRDLYILEKYIWKGNIIPIDDVQIFCKWYRYTREHRKTEKYDVEKVFFVQFEDLIYKYEETTSQIDQWLQFTNVKKKKRKNFDPKKSISNTRLWTKYEKEEKNIRYIENELREYLYF